MFFQGVLGASPVLANVHSDIIGILTGVITSPAQLSSSFQAGAVFNNTVAPGWELYDNAAGAAANTVTPKVIRAPYSDDPTKFKNIWIGSAVAAQIGFNGFEAWNAANHTGTNPMQTSIASGGFQSYTPAAYQMITISVSANHIFMIVSANLVSAAICNIYFTEFTRDDPWNTVANGYPSWLQTGFGNTGGQAFALTTVPRLYDSTIKTDRTSLLLSGNNYAAGAPCVIFCPNGQQMVNGNIHQSGGAGLGGQSSCPILQNNYLGADANKDGAKFLYDIAIRMHVGYIPSFNGAFLGGNCSAKAPHLFYIANNAIIGDVIVMNGKKYLIVGLLFCKFAVLME